MADGDPQADDRSIVTKISARSVSATVEAFTALLLAKGVRIFAVIDQAAAATDAGLSLRPTVLVIFGSPAGGTPVMQAVPLAALDLPLKVLIWDDGGTTKVSYLSPAALAARHGLDERLSAPLAAVDRLTDALVAA